MTSGNSFGDILAGALAGILLSALPVDVFGAANPPPNLGEAVCGPLKTGYGPFDYRTVAAADRAIVEQYHFTPSVAALQRGQSGRLGGDIDYTLRAMPNHHPALSAMTRLAKRERTSRPAGATWSIECYFDRALRMAPDDGRVYGQYAAFLVDEKRPDEARWAVGRAEELAPNDVVLAYNLGLISLELGDADGALRLARKAYSGGIELPGLRTKLQVRGKWSE